LNVVGYGVDNPFIPPITKPVTVMDWIDRYFLVMGHSAVFLWEFWLAWMINWDDGDKADTYIYNNAHAAGSQLYPHGIHKYYDMYSDEGFGKYFEDLVLFYIMYSVSSFTILPWGLW